MVDTTHYEGSAARGESQLHSARHAAGHAAHQVRLRQLAQHHPRAVASVLDYCLAPPPGESEFRVEA